MYSLSGREDSNFFEQSGLRTLHTRWSDLLYVSPTHFAPALLRCSVNFNLRVFSYRSRKLSQPARCTGLSRCAITRRCPVLISAVMFIAGVRHPRLPSIIMRAMAPIRAIYLLCIGYDIFNIDDEVRDRSASYPNTNC